MPVIRVALFPGRTRAQKRAFARAVTEAFVAICGGMPESVQVVFEDVPQDDWAVAGRLASDPAPAQPVACAYAIEGTGPPVLLVHGIGARRQSWEGVIGYLKADFQCISYDLRGHGDSPKPDESFGLEELVADLEALRARLGIERAHIVGHSLGGMIAPTYARAYPHRVISLGLLSTAAFRSDEDRAKVRAVVTAMEQRGIAEALDTLADRWFTDAFIKEHPERIAARKRQVLDTARDVFLNVFDIYVETEMGPWLHEVKAPTLVLTGALDAGCNPRLNRSIADALPRAELVILEGVKHAILIEAADRVAAALMRFLPAHGAVEPAHAAGRHSASRS